MALRYLTAGESHGPALAAIAEGFPAGLEIDFDQVTLDLRRRQKGYGRGDRQKIERDEAQFLSGIRGGVTLGSPIALVVWNKDHESWKDLVSPTARGGPRFTRPRPGHADLVAILKAIVTTGGDILAARDGKYLARGIASLPWTSPVVDKGVLYIVDEAGAVAYRLPWEITEPLKLAKLWAARPPADRYYASPVVHEGLVYAVNQGGMLSVLDAASGAVVYSRRIPLGGTFYPSICLEGNRIFVSSDSGRTVVLEPGREYREVASNTLEPFRSTPVFSGSRMYVRTVNHLFCIGK